MKIKNDIECIFEKVYIETSVDTDGDGKPDLIAAYIRRPVSTLKGEKVPAVFVANPYMMLCNEDDYKPHNVNVEVNEYPQQSIKEEDIRFDFSKEIKYQPEVVRETKGYAETAIVEEEPLDCISDLYKYLNQMGYASVF